MMPPKRDGRPFVLAALLITGFLGSACIYDFEIPGGDAGTTTTEDPSHACAPNDTCTTNCVGGSCKPSCGANSSCTVNCTGGSCHTTCAANATCNISCVGGSCVSECQGKCTIDCLGGSCQCTGPGCP